MAFDYCYPQKYLLWLLYRQTDIATMISQIIQTGFSGIAHYVVHGQILIIYKRHLLNDIPIYFSYIFVVWNGCTDFQINTLRFVVQETYLNIFVIISFVFLSYRTYCLFIIRFVEQKKLFFVLFGIYRVITILFVVLFSIEKSCSEEVAFFSKSSIVFIVSYAEHFCSQVSKSSMIKSAASSDNIKSFGYIFKSIWARSSGVKPMLSSSYSSKKTP